MWAVWIPVHPSIDQTFMNTTYPKRARLGVCGLSPGGSGELGRIVRERGPGSALEPREP